MVNGRRGQATTQKERELITARLFRRDAPKDIARDMGVSERSIRRMSKSLREHGTPIPPREPKPRGRHQLLSPEEHDGLAEYVTNYPIALRSDMVKYVKDNYAKDVTEATVGRAIKRMGFTQIIIMRGSRAVRHDLPPEAARVHEIAAEAIDQQMKINAEVKAQHAKEAKVYSGGPRKGTCAWVRLPPGGDTGFNPRTPRSNGKKDGQASQQQTAQEGQQMLEMLEDGEDDEGMEGEDVDVDVDGQEDGGEPNTPPLPISSIPSISLPGFMQGLADTEPVYISPYS